MINPYITWPGTREVYMIRKAFWRGLPDTGSAEDPTFRIRNLPSLFEPHTGVFSRYTHSLDSHHLQVQRAASELT